MKRRKCEACGGRGIFAPARPSCRIAGETATWIIVERCDSCDAFEDDLAAALSLYRVAGWFPCQSGALHALANRRTRRRSFHNPVQDDACMSRESADFKGLSAFPRRTVAPNADMAASDVVRLTP